MEVKVQVSDEQLQEAVINRVLKAVHKPDGAYEGEGHHSGKMTLDAMIQCTM